MIEMEPGTSYKPVQNDHVKRTERSTHLHFPESYLKFMAINNGGVPLRSKLTVANRNITIDRFLHLIPDYKTNRELGIYDIGVVHSQIFYLLGECQAPFALLRGGDFICLDGDGRDEAQVVLWDSELSEEDAPVNHHVADSFEEFVEIHQKFATE